MRMGLAEKLRCLLDQPVRIYTDDERIIAGMVVGVSDDFVRILECCGDIFLVSICNIASIEEPHMHLHPRHCKRKFDCCDHCECDDDPPEEDNKCGCGKCRRCCPGC